MKTNPDTILSLHHRSRRGYSLLEICAVIGVLAIFTTGTVLLGNYWSKYSDAVAAGGALRSVKQAQVDFLTDHPNLSVADLSAHSSDFLGYLPGGALPSLPKFNGQTATIDYSVYPPRAIAGGQPVQFGDPDDGLWDAGR
jgi:type II secretory pathway pseudopilin PulG